MPKMSLLRKITYGEFSDFVLEKKIHIEQNISCLKLRKQPSQFHGGLLDEKLQRNASKFAIFLELRKPINIYFLTFVLLQKYGIFWSISLEFFIEQTPWNCEVWKLSRLPQKINDDIYEILLFYFLKKYALPCAFMSSCTVVNDIYSVTVKFFFQKSIYEKDFFL